jgi:hypothetical protein
MDVKRLLKKILLFLILTLLYIETASAETFYAEGSTGQDIQNVLNQCFPGDTVHVFTRTYIISSQLVIPQGVTLEGEGWNTVLKLMDDAPTSTFGKQVPIILGNSHITICNLKEDLNAGNQKYVPWKSTGIQMGMGHHNGIGIGYADDITIHDVWIDNGLGDHIRLRSCTNVHIYNCKFSKAGHEDVFLIQCSDAEIYDNYFIPYDNSGARVWRGNNIAIYNNVFEGSNLGCHAIQIQDDDGTMSGIEVCGNIMKDIRISAMWIVDKSHNDREELWIHDNVIQGCGWGKSWVAGGIVASGYGNLVIEDNVFDGNYGGAVRFREYNGAWGYAATATLRNNIITNTHEWEKVGSEGYGIINEISAQDVVTENNCFYANIAGNAEGCRLSSSDYFSNPKTTPTDCTVYWDGNEWKIPGVEPHEYGNTLNEYTDEVSDDEIDQFDSIFDVLLVNSYTQVGENDTVVLPEGMEESKGKALGTIDYQKIGNNTVTLVNIPDKYLEGASEVRYNVNGKEEVHTIMVGEKTSEGIVFTKTSIWEGDLDHTRNSLRLDNKIDARDITVTIITPTDSFQPVLEVSSTVTEPIRIHPAIFFIIGNVLFGILYVLFILRNTV